MSTDTGLASLALLLRFHGIAVDSAQVRHRFGSVAIGISEMLRCAKEFKLKARAVQTNWARIQKLPLPAIAENHDGTFFIVAKCSGESVLVQEPSKAPAML